VVKQIYVRTQIYGVFRSNFLRTSGLRGNEYANIRTADSIGLSDHALREGGTIRLSAGTISDSSYYYDNFVYSDGVGS
jgi:hypothetical protein